MQQQIHAGKSPQLPGGSELLNSISVLQDGRICEAVAWEVGPSERHTIPDLIVRCILERHQPGAVVQGFAGMLDWTLQQQGATLDEQIHARR